MLANSFVGFNSVFGRLDATLVRVTGETYSIATGDTTAATVEHPLRVRLRGIASHDRKWIGAAALERAEAVVAFMGTELAEGLRPTTQDTVQVGADRYEILTVRESETAGRPVKWELACAKIPGSAEATP